ncbi:30S ribosomal protein S19e [groundwater metagenome]|uniref:30S ribosomal protein S19e n=1 Tax=groundwater metagenome TaxID=717931 RepID=A0A098E5Y0_9ZZZZ
MTTPYDVLADKLIDVASKDLKENLKFKKPEWTDFVKTGVSKERAPEDADWWWVRAASILRKLYMENESTGVGRFRTVYGGRKNMGVKPEHFYKGSGKVIRTILQGFDNLGLTEKSPKGRKITEKGKTYLNNLCNNLQ